MTTQLTWFLVIYFSYTCPGGFLSGLWPAAVKPIVCKATPDYYMISSLELARKKIREKGPGARLLGCRGLRCVDHDFEWKNVVKFEGD